MAAALEAKLLPRVEALVDVHSGGASLRYLPSSVITRYGQDALDPRLPALARAFGLPHCIYFRGTEAGSMPAAASRHGVLRLSAEIGGGAETGQALVDRCREGLLGCLRAGPAEPRASTPGSTSPYDLDAPAATRAHGPGVFIPGVELGQRISARQRVGRLIEPARPDTPAHTLLSPQAGTVLCLRAIARSDDGDCLLQAAPALPLDSFLAVLTHADESRFIRPALHPPRDCFPGDYPEGCPSCLEAGHPASLECVTRHRHRA